MWWWWWKAVVGVVLTCLAGGRLPIANAAKFTECRLESAGVYLAISSEAEVDSSSGTAVRWLEASWYGMSDGREGDSWIGLWDKDPAGSPSGPLAQSPASGSDGVVRFEERWDGSLLPASVGGTEDSCLPYWTGYVRDGVLLYSACLMLRPHWMSGLRADLRETRLSKVALPGTHDSGASGRFGTPIVGDLVGRWTFTQDESLWQQLVLGARYVDMRIAYYPSAEERFFVNHGEVPIAPLQRYIDDVVDFMSQTEEEVVIFDIHELQIGFDGYPERHEELIALLESSFGKWMAPNALAPDPTMGELWERGSTLIVTYPTREASQSSYLWDRVYHLWGDTNKLSDLEAFLYTGIPQQSERGSLWAAMAEFTPSVYNVAANTWGGLRGAAAITNPEVTRWFRQDWWNQVNIVAMDYLPASDVVSVAVAANKMRRQCVGAKEEHMSDRAKRWWASTAATFGGPTATEVDPNGPRVWLWVSALASISPEGEITQRQLEINWDVPEVQEGDWVGLFDHDPSDSWLATVRRVTPEVSVGHHLTNVTLPHLPVHANMAEASCLGWWAAYVRRGVPIATDCVKVRPRWMSTFKEQLSGVALRDLVVPGVHDAGTYTPFSAIADTALYKYAITQDESIYGQLVFGNRYIDLRVGYFEAEPDEPYWVVHGVTVWRPFRTVLRELRSFVEDTGEVVVADVGGFTFFETGAQHEGCITLITEVLEELMAPRSHGWEAPLGDLLQTPSGLIVIYNNQAASDHSLFWPSIPGRWADAQSLADLEDYMEQVFEADGPPPTPWTLSGQLTPLAVDVITDDLGGLRVMADGVNRNVTRWLRTRWWQQISFISCDFVLSAGYVDVAIEVNLRRLNQLPEILKTGKKSLL